MVDGGKGKMGSYFAEMCEHMVATVSMLPNSLRNRFDKSIPK